MSFRLKNVVLFVIIICMLMMLIGCRNEKQEEELFSEIITIEDEEATEAETNVEFTEEVLEELKPTEPVETTVATEHVSTNNTTEKVEESKPIVEYPITEPTTEHEEYIPEVPEVPETDESTEEETEVDVETEVEVEEENSNLVSLGEFQLTAYCACSQCCGKSDGITATGTTATQGRTIAVDPSVIPYGTAVTFNGNTYIAEDCGGAIGGNRIDVFFDNHQDAINFGVQYAEVFVEGN